MKQLTDLIKPVYKRLGFNNTIHLCTETNALPHSQAPAQLFGILGTRRLVNPNTCLESAHTRSPPYIQVVDCIKMADNTNVKVTMNKLSYLRIQ